jgi:hypothetical protein
MSFNRSRLRRIEEASRGGRCPECKLPPDGPGYIVLDGEDPVLELPEVCPRCGRNTRTRIVVVEEGDEGEGGDTIGQMLRHNAGRHGL